MKEKIKHIAAFQAASIGLAGLLNILTTELLGWDNGVGFAGMIFFLVCIEGWWLACRHSREQLEAATPKKETAGIGKYEGALVWACFLGVLVVALIIV